MYDTTIKEKFRQGLSGLWGGSVEEKQFTVILTFGNMSLLWDRQTGMLLDIFSNKVEKFSPVPIEKHTIYVEAKNIEYAERFNLRGIYRVTGFTSGVPSMLVIDNGESSTTILPSRLRVVEVDNAVE